MPRANFTLWTNGHMQAGLEPMAVNEPAAAAADTAWPPRWQRIAGEALPAMLPELPALRSGFKVSSPWGVVLLLTLLAGALRFLDIGGETFWKNELFSVYWVKNPFEFLLTKGLITETNPPLYFVLLKLWTGVFGSSEAAVRSLSTLASTASIPLAYLLGLELGGVAVGLVGATLLAISPVQLYFAHEARVYAFLPLFTLVTMLGLCRFLRTPDTRGFMPDRRFANSLDIYALGAIALLYSHASSVLVLAALGLTTLLYFAEIRAPRSQVLAFLFANVIVALLASPAIMALAMQAKSPNIEWMPPLSLAGLMAVLHCLMVAPVVRFDVTGTAREVLAWTELGMAVAALAMLSLAARRRFRDRLSYALLVLFPLLFVMLLCAVSMVRPILIPRLAVWLVVPVMLVAAVAFTQSKAPRLRLLAIVLTAGCILLGLSDTSFAPARHNPDWRGFVADARAAGIADDAVLVAGPHAGPLGILYYGGPAIAEHLRQWRPPPGHQETNAEWLERTTSGARPISTAQIGDAIRAGRPVSLFLDDDDEPLIRDLRTQLPALATATRRDYAALIVFTWPGAAHTP